MTDKHKLELLKLAEISFCGILIEKGICEYIRQPKKNSRSKTHNNMSNMRVLEPYASNIGYKELSLEYALKLQKCYPSYSDRKGTKSVIQMKFSRFLDENPKYSPEYIINAVTDYVVNAEYSNSADMLFNLDNIFYKKLGKIEKSPMVGILEKFGDANLKEENSNSDENSDEEDSIYLEDDK